MAVALTTSVNAEVLVNQLVAHIPALCRHGVSGSSVRVSSDSPDALATPDLRRRAPVATAGSPRCYRVRIGEMLLSRTITNRTGAVALRPAALTPVASSV
jgi:hypothetical protein